jgi:hypothetical protein
VLQIHDANGTMPDWAMPLAQKILKTEGVQGHVFIYWRYTKSRISSGKARPYGYPKQIIISAGTLVSSQRDLLIHELVHLVREKERGKRPDKIQWHDSRFYQILFYWQYAVGDMVIAIYSELDYKSRGAKSALELIGLDVGRLPSRCSMYVSKRPTTSNEIKSSLRKRVKPISKGWRTFDPDMNQIFSQIEYTCTGEHHVS